MKKVGRLLNFLLFILSLFTFLLPLPRDNHHYAHFVPTLLTIFGLRFYFFLDEHEPIHVHVNANGKKAKIALEPEVSVVYNHGLKEQELKKAIETCRIYREDFITEWHKRFG